MRALYAVARAYMLTTLVSTSLLAPAGVRGDDTEELAKKTQNPVSDLISVPFQNNTNFGMGPHDDTQNVLNIQPVIPIRITEQVMVINRTIVPLVWQPDIRTGTGGDFGLSDINHTSFFSPAKPGKLIWGVGPVIQLPTSVNDRLGPGKLGLGPAAVGLTVHGPWVIGALANHIWSLAGDSDTPYVNLTTAQPFINYNFGKSGFSLVSAPIVTANWHANGDDIWNVPIGGGVGQVVKVGAQAFSLGLQGYWNAARPDAGASTTLRLVVAMLFPK